MGINIANFVAQLITFLIVLIVLAKYAFPALFRILDQRESLIRQGVENAEKAQREVAEAEKRVQAMFDEARVEAQASIARATHAAEQLRAGIERDAQARANDILAQAERRIAQEVAQAREQLRRDVADLAIGAAEHVVGKSLDQETGRRLVAEFVSQSRDLQC